MLILFIFFIGTVKANDTRVFNEPIFGTAATNVYNESQVQATSVQQVGGSEVSQDNGGGAGGSGTGQPVGPVSIDMYDMGLIVIGFCLILFYRKKIWLVKAKMAE